MARWNEKWKYKLKIVELSSLEYGIALMSDDDKKWNWWWFKVPIWWWGIDKSRKKIKKLPKFAFN